MRSVGPFLLTDEEFSGLQFLLEEDPPTRVANIQPGPSLITGFDLGTGESGETAEVEAESAEAENTPITPETITVVLHPTKNPRLHR